MSPGGGTGRLRVIGGALGGRRLRTVPGLAVRPTAERVREALFDILGARVAGAAFLDAYAGTGAVGIEALSRGARSATFVERHRGALEALRRNTSIVSDPGQSVRLIAADLAQALSMLQKEKGGCCFDLVFLDPPYAPGEIERGLRLIAASGLLRPDAVVVAEHESSGSIPSSSALEATRTVTYGRTSLTFYRLGSSGGTVTAAPRPGGGPSR